MFARSSIAVAAALFACTACVEEDPQYEQGLGDGLSGDSSATASGLETPETGGGETTDTGQGDNDGTCQQRPDDGMYAWCTGADGDCSTGAQLFIADTDGNATACACTGLCTSDAECPDLPGCSAIGVCIPGQSSDLCALDCGAGRQCPGGMECRTLKLADESVRQLCL